MWEEESHKNYIMYMEYAMNLENDSLDNWEPIKHFTR